MKGSENQAWQLHSKGTTSKSHWRLLQGTSCCLYSWTESLYLIQLPWSTAFQNPHPLPFPKSQCLCLHPHQNGSVQCLLPNVSFIFTWMVDPRPCVCTTFSTLRSKFLALLWHTQINKVEKSSRIITVFIRCQEGKNHKIVHYVNVHTYMYFSKSWVPSFHQIFKEVLNSHILRITIIWTSFV